MLQVHFTERYPLEPPEVVFVPPHTPVHPHVYSNGHICLGARRGRKLRTYNSSQGDI